MKTRLFAGLALASCLLAPTLASAADAKPFDAGALRVEVQGKGERAVILIPGLASGPWVWRDTAPRLAKTHTVYLVTVAGFDGLPARPGVTLESLQRDLLTLIESRKLVKPVLVGHSMGGTLSLAFAADHSAKIAGVVAVDGLPVFPGTENVPDRKFITDGMRATFANQTRERFEAAQQSYMDITGTVSEILAKELAPLASRSDMATVADFAIQLMALDMRSRMKSIQVPVLLISPFNAPDFAIIGVNESMKTEYYRSLMPGTPSLEVVSISPARHFVMFDQPEKFATALDAALARMFESPAK